MERATNEATDDIPFPTAKCAININYNDGTTWKDVFNVHDGNPPVPAENQVELLSGYTPTHDSTEPDDNIFILKVIDLNGNVIAQNEARMELGTGDVITFFSQYKKCGTCKHWDPPHGDHVHGQCGKIEDREYIIDLETAATFTRGYGDFGMEAGSAFMSKSSFGCVLHEPK